MTGQELVDKCLEIKNKYSTKYAKGTFGQCATPSFIYGKAKQYPEWYTPKDKPSRLPVLLALPDDTRLFDCVGLIKGVIWGFPNIVYTSNGMRDMNDQTIWEKATDKSLDFSNIQIGELLWLQGHVGVYIGDGKAIECTGSWEGKLMITAVENTGKQPGLHGRKWTGHGKIPTISYEKKKTTIPGRPFYYVKSGDTLTSIAAAYEMTVEELASYNPQIKNINLIRTGERVYLSPVLDSPEYYIVKKGDILGKIAIKYNTSEDKLLGLNPDIKNPNLIFIGQKIRVK